MELKAISNNQMRQNIYVYFCPLSKEGVIIDPGHNIEELIKYVNVNEIKIAKILLTHGHFDHIHFAKEASAAFNAQIHCHADEAEMLKSPELNLSSYISRQKVSLSPDGLLNEGDEIGFGGCTLKVLHTPGHTPGCICFYDETNAVVFTGDTLFFESVGRTDLPKSSTTGIINNIKEKLFTLPTHVKVYPGHGAATSIGHETVNNEIVNEFYDGTAATG